MKIDAVAQSSIRSGSALGLPTLWTFSSVSDSLLLCSGCGFPCILQESFKFQIRSVLAYNHIALAHDDSIQRNKRTATSAMGDRRISRASEF